MGEQRGKWKGGECFLYWLRGIDAPGVCPIVRLSVQMEFDT